MAIPILANLYAIGDSTTAGSGASGAAFRYTNIVAASTGFSLTNEGVGSTEILQHSTKCFGHYTTVNPIIRKNQFILLSGYNDMRHYGTNANHLTYFTDTLYANAVWCAIPDKYKITGQNASGRISLVGTWSNETTYTGIGKTSSTLNDTATCYVYGSVVYVCGLAVQSGTGKFTLTIDGVNQGTYNCYDSDSLIITNHPFLVRITGLSNSVHKVVLTVAVNGGATAFYYATGNGGLNYGDPVNSLDCSDVYIGTMQYMTQDAYSMYAPYDQGSDSAVDLYNTNINTVCSNLLSDNLNVTKVDVNAYYPTTTDYFHADLVHPNNAGHQAIADAFISKIKTNYSRIYII